LTLKLDPETIKANKAALESKKKDAPVEVKDAAKKDDGKKGKKGKK
jgi:hypothetical protein